MDTYSLKQLRILLKDYNVKGRSYIYNKKDCKKILFKKMKGGAVPYAVQYLYFSIQVIKNRMKFNVEETIKYLDSLESRWQNIYARNPVLLLLIKLIILKYGNDSNIDSDINKLYYSGGSVCYLNKCIEVKDYIPFCESRKLPLFEKKTLEQILTIKPTTSNTFLTEYTRFSGFLNLLLLYAYLMNIPYTLESLSRVSNQILAERVMNGLSLHSEFYTKTRDNCVLYHGGTMMFDRTLEPITSLTQYSSPTFISTSLNLNIAQEFVRDTLYIIHVPRGTKVIPMNIHAEEINQHEDEILFPPHTEFKILKCYMVSIKNKIVYCVEMACFTE
jgi:hypothetical protein